MMYRNSNTNQCEYWYHKYFKLWKILRYYIVNIEIIREQKFVRFADKGREIFESQLDFYLDSVKLGTRIYSFSLNNFVCVRLVKLDDIACNILGKFDRLNLNWIVVEVNEIFI